MSSTNRFFKEAAWSAYEEYESWTERKEQKELNTPAKPAQQELLGFERIEELMETARANGLKSPKLQFDGLCLKAAGLRSNNPRAVYVTESADFNSTYLGKILHGKYYPSKAADCEVVEQRLREIAANPELEFRQYGKATGICCCCGRTLTNPDSIEAGIGPICANKWGV